MKLLLTSGGITNKSIEKAMVELVGKPISETSILFVPTAANTIPGDKSWLIKNIQQLQKKGYKSVDVLDIAGVSQNIWRPRFEAADLIYFGGGDVQYLVKEMRGCGLDAMLPEFLKTRVYMGISAGSMAVVRQLPSALMEKLYDDDPAEAGVQTIPFGYVDCLLIPHLDSENFENVRKEMIEPFRSQLKYPLYALDDDSALKVVDGKIEVVSEGNYLVFEK